MGTNEAESGKPGELVPIEQGQIQRLPDESKQAYAAMRTYYELDPGQRTIAAAYRALKGVAPAIKVPGYFDAWERKYRWKERVAVWDSYFGGLVVSRNAGQLEAARQPTVAQTERIQSAIESELETLESANRARLIALGGEEPE